MILLCLLILVSVGLGIVWHTQHYLIIDFQLYPRDIRSLDLRGQQISVSHYNKLRRNLPDCQILWDIPIQGTYYPQDVTSLCLTDLTVEEAQLLAFFPQLTTLDARGCENYALLGTVQRTYPQVQVLYTVTIGGKTYDQDARVLHVDGIAPEDLALLEYLPELDLVRLESGRNPQQLQGLVNICAQLGLPVQVVFGGVGYDTNVSRLSLEGIAEEEVPLLYFLPKLKQLELTEPEACAESIGQLVRDLPDTDITWEISLYGLTLTADMEQLDLTAYLSEEGALAYEKAKTASVQGERDPIPYQFALNGSYPLPDMTVSTKHMIQQVERALAYYPNIREVVLCGAILDNNAMAEFREAHRQEYKVVWSVQCGNKMIVRTDTPYLMPTKHYVYYFLDSDAANLKYCEEIKALDLGHMAISDIGWVRNMPDLEYLVLAHTQLQYIEPISSCKKLKFLELDWSPIRDYTPLKGCTALEDLNLGNTYADFTPIEEMTWLKNLWMIGCSQGPRSRMPQILTNTKVMVTGEATVANGWRELPNYYAMRDILGMYYMSW